MPFVVVTTDHTRRRVLPADLISHQTDALVPEQYLRLLKKSSPFFQEEFIEEKIAIKEYLMMGLRTQEGISHQDFQKLFGENFPTFFRETILNNVQLGRLITDISHTAPTRQGYLWNNQMVREFFDCGDCATTDKKAVFR